MELATASTSTVSLDERAFSVDSAASLHVMCETDLSPEELETAEVPGLPTTVITANGSIDTTDEAVVSVKDLDTFVAIQLLEDTPERCYLWEKFPKKLSISNEWKEGATPNLFENGKTAPCKCDNSVHLVVSGRSGEAHLTSSAEESAESIKELTPDE